MATGDTAGASWTETPACPLCEAPEVPAPPRCVSVEGAGCTSGCRPPRPRCREGEGGEGSTGGTGVAWEGSPSCAVGGLGPLPALLVVLVAALARRARWLAAALLVVAARAHAVDVDRLGYSDGRGWATLVDGDPGGAWQTRAALSGAVLSRPLVARYPSGDVFPLVGFASTLALGGSLTLDPRVRLGVVLPLHPLAIDGVGDSAVMTPGDASFSLAVPLAEPGAKLQGVWQVAGELPTGDPARFLGGTGSVCATLAGRSSPAPRTSIGAALGLRLRPDEELSATRWGSAVEYGVGGAVRPRDALEAGLELFGSLGLRDDTLASLPLEWLATARWPADGRVSVRLGGGGGVGRGLGNPRARGLLAVELASEPGADQDADGYPDPRDLCRRRPEDRDAFRDLDGCPDLDDDGDGIVDAADACRLAPETPNGWRDDDGCPDARAHVTVEVLPLDIETARVQVGGGAPLATLPGQPLALELDPGPLALEVTAEGFEPQRVERAVGEGPTRVLVELTPLPAGSVTVRVRDEAGAPLAAEVRVVAAPDGAAAAEVVDRAPPLPAPEGVVVAPFAAGPVAVVADAAGFVRQQVLARAPDEGTAEVELVLRRPGVALVGRQIVVGRAIGFDLDRPTPAPASDLALDDVARWLLAHPEVELVRVEGHADEVGDPRYNLALSEQRAESVVAALVARGVARERLAPLGSGESVRLSDPRSERVVDFLVLVWAEP